MIAQVVKSTTKNIIQKLWMCYVCEKNLQIVITNVFCINKWTNLLLIFFSNLIVSLCVRKLNEISLQKKRKIWNTLMIICLSIFLSATGIPYVIYSAQTQQNTMATPSNISSLGVYPMSSCAPSQSDTSPRTTDIQVSDLPPSYEEYMASHVTETI